MKIIAEGDVDFLARVTAEEWANLEGYRSAHERDQMRRGKIRVGAEIDVGTWYKAAKTIVNNAERIRDLRDTLTGQVKALDQQLEAIGEPRIES
jgi:hypothetical protein